MATMIPSVLKMSVQNENQATMVSTEIVDPDSFNAVSGSFAKARFMIPKKFSAIGSGHLLFRLNWDSKSSASVDTNVTLSRMAGGLCALRECRLYIGKEVSRTTEVGKLLAGEVHLSGWEHQCEILDLKHGSNHQYSYDSDGFLQLTPDKLNGVSIREMKDQSGYGVEISVPLKQLFPMFHDMLIPTGSGLKDDIIVEIDFTQQYSDIAVESGAGSITAGQKVVSIKAPRLMLDYIQYPDVISNALNDQLASPEGQSIMYRQKSLVKSTLEAIGDDDQQSKDIYLGFNNRSVLGFTVAKLNSAVTNPQLLRCRSDALNGEKYNVIVNNKTLYDRTVDNEAAMYSSLNQTYDTDMHLIPGSYEAAGQYATANHNIFNDEVFNGSSIYSGNLSTGVQEAYQGALRYVGVNLAKIDNKDDVPSNAVKIGPDGLILRYERKSGDDGEAQGNNARSKSSVEMFIWVHSISALVIRNGRAQKIDL